MKNISRGNGIYLGFISLVTFGDAITLGNLVIETMIHFIFCFCVIFLVHKYHILLIYMYDTFYILLSCLDLWPACSSPMMYLAEKHLKWSQISLSLSITEIYIMLFNACRNNLHNSIARINNNVLIKIVLPWVIIWSSLVLKGLV